MSLIKAIVKLLGVLLFLLISYNGFGQEETVKIKGRVRSFNNDVSNVLVVNLNSKHSTITDTEGLFSLGIRPRDSIQFSAIQYVSKKIIITATLLKQNLIFVDLVENVVKLNGVTVTPNNLTGKIDLDIRRLDIERVITSSSFKSPNGNITVISRSERSLREADRGKLISQGVKFDSIAMIPMVFATFNTHTFLNRLIGRTKSLKDEVSRDESLKMENKIVRTFSRETMSEAFGISQNYIDGFLSFCSAQKDFSKLSEATNSFQIWEYLKDKSKEYKRANNSIQLVKTD